jgi:thioredoxin reductase (NADPH)
MYDLIIIGSGPAGMSAAIYATRAKLDFIIIEQNFMGGGQVVNTYEIDNYPGLPGISGPDLSMKMQEHAQNLGAEFVTETVTELDLGGEVKKVTTDMGTYEARTVILAMGAEHRKLGVPGEDTYAGMGVSYCATCDGAFYRNKDTAVVGGGDVAVEDAIFLARLCNKVYVVHRRDELRAAKVLQDRLLAMPNVEMVWDSTLKSIDGDGQVRSIVTVDKKDGSERTIPVDGVFIAVGIQPISGLVSGKLDLDQGGYVIADETGATSLPGVFVAGDLRKKQLRQIITACADGANAVTSVQDYLIRH